MNSLSIYVLAIDLMLDTNSQFIIDNRVIKRLCENSIFPPQYLKGNIMQYERNQHNFINHLTPFETITLKKRLSFDETKTIMQPQFDLFKDLHTLITTEDDPTLQALVFVD